MAESILAPTSCEYDGGCTCGQVRYRMLSNPLFVHCCHCRWCQRETGTAFALNALIESDRLVLLNGEIEAVEIPSASGRGQKVSRCPHCRIALWSHYAGAGEALGFVRVGTLDDPTRFAPDIHIYTDSRQPWVTIPADIPSVPGYYRATQYWPSESLKRRAALNTPPRA